MSIRNVKTTRKPAKRKRLRLNDTLPKTVIVEGTVLSVTLPYPPVSGNHAVRHFRNGGHKVADAVKAYYARVALQIRQAGLQLNLVGPLAVEYQLFAPDLRERDTCNAQKVFKDALTKAAFWFDDSNKVIRREVFEWGTRVKGEAARVVVTVRGYQP